MTSLVRTLQLGLRGKDVYAAKRTVHRYLRDGKLAELAKKKPVAQETFGPYFVLDVTRARKKAKMPWGTKVTPTLWEVMRRAGAPDALALELMEQYRVEHIPLPKFIEPYQGFGSLDKSLWHAYTIGRRKGLVDGPGYSSGTFNGASTLPGGGKSDHAVGPPALAFDLDTDPAGPAGWDHPAAQAFFHEMIGRPEIHYVILGRWIWSREMGVHRYTAGSHFNHVHVSGNR